MVELKTDWTLPFNKDFLEQLFEFTHHNPKSGPETVIFCGISQFFPIFRRFKFLDSTALVSTSPNIPSPAALFWPLLILLDKENHDSEADKLIVWALPVGLVRPHIYVLKASYVGESFEILIYERFGDILEFMIKLRCSPRAAIGRLSHQSTVGRELVNGCMRWIDICHPQRSTFNRCLFST